MNTNLKISVVVPVYKVEKYLDKCVKSIVRQTHKNLEIILIDDGSPDNCPQICDEWAERDERIKVIHKDNNGVSSARNDALEIVTGEYIGFVDSDDFIEQNMYEYLLENLVASGADIAECGYISIDENTGSKLKSLDTKFIHVFNQTEYLRRIVLGGDAGFLWNKLYKSELFQNVNFDENILYSEDLLVNYLIAKKIRKAINLPEYKYYYLQKQRTKDELKINEHSLDPVKVKKFILESNKDNADVYPYCIKGFVISAYAVLHAASIGEEYNNIYKQLRTEILNFRNYIFKSSLFNRKDKIKTLILLLGKNIFKLFVR